MENKNLGFKSFVCGILQVLSIIFFWDAGVSDLTPLIIMGGLLFISFVLFVMSLFKDTFAGKVMATIGLLLSISPILIAAVGFAV